MKLSKVFGVALILVGIGLLGYYADCTWWRPTREVLQMRANQAEYGGISALSPDPTKIFLLAGVASLISGGALWKK